MYTTTSASQQHLHDHISPRALVGHQRMRSCIVANDTAQALASAAAAWPHLRLKLSTWQAAHRRLTCHPQTASWPEVSQLERLASLLGSNKGLAAL